MAVKLEAILGTPSGTCETVCHSDGGCEVRYSIEQDDSYWQKGFGTCMPARRGGACNIHEYCRIGNHVDEQCGTPCKPGKRAISPFTRPFTTTRSPSFPKKPTQSHRPWTTTPTGTCETLCSPNGTCKVKFALDDNGHKLWGHGMCFPENLGGECKGIHESCRRGNHVSQQCGKPCRDEKRMIGTESLLSTTISPNPSRTSSPAPKRPGLPTLPSGICSTSCSPNGSCKVSFSIDDNGHKQWGHGSCFPEEFGGKCSGIHELCRIGNHVSQQCGSPCQSGTRDIKVIKYSFAPYDIFC